MRKGLTFPFLIGLVTLSGCDSGDLPQGRLVLAELVSCSSVQDLVSQRAQYWSDEVQRPQLVGQERAAWQDSIPLMIKNHPGVVLHVAISWYAEINVYRKFGRSEQITVGEWKERAESGKVFSNEYGGNCESYPLGSRAYFLLGSMGRDGTPPTHLADFLGVEELSRIPQVFTNYLPRDWRMAQSGSAK